MATSVQHAAGPDVSTAMPAAAIDAAAAAAPATASVAPVALARLARLRSDLKRFELAPSPSSLSLLSNGGALPSADASSGAGAGFGSGASSGAFGLPEQVDLPDDTVTLIAACCRPGMTVEEARIGTELIQAHVRTAMLGPLNDVLDDCRTRLADLWAQLLAEIQMREAAELHQLHLERELDMLRATTAAAPGAASGPTSGPASDKLAKTDTTATTPTRPKSGGLRLPKAFRSKSQRVGVRAAHGASSPPQPSNPPPALAAPTTPEAVRSVSMPAVLVRDDDEPAPANGSTAGSEAAAATTVPAARSSGFSLKALLAARPTASDLPRQLRRARAERDQLRHDLGSLETLYCAMVENRSLLFFEKELLTLELETLTRDLFEEANRMVANEARLRAQLESSNQQLSAELERVIRSLEEDLSHHRDRVAPGTLLAARDRRLAATAAAAAAAATAAATTGTVVGRRARRVSGPPPVFAPLSAAAAPAAGTAAGSADDLARPMRQPRLTRAVTTEAPPSLELF